MSRARKPFKFHLRTAVLMMLEIGALLALNFNTIDTGYYIEFGWPLAVYWESAAMAKVSSDSLSPPLEILMFLINVMFAATVLYSTFRISEYLIRRREGRKP